MKTDMAAGPQATSAPGLEGVIAAETVLSDVDGERGRLVIAGSDVESLAGEVSFEELAFRIWSPYHPDVRRARVREQLGEARRWAYVQLGSFEDALRLGDGMDALRAGLARLTEAPGASALDSAIRLTAMSAVFTSSWTRIRAGSRPIPPDPAAGHGHDLLRMCGAPVAEARADALEAYLVTVSDHGMNASTFTARVIASTGSDTVSAVVGAVGALKGPLHGGAPGPVLDMLDAVRDPARAEAWLEAELLAGRRIMGMGHRIYRVRDPRAAVLEREVERLQSAGLRSERLGLARAVERAAEEALRDRHPDRPLRANVEFYTAILLDALGLDRALFSPLFACGRVLGWTAHIAEQRATGRLIRPASRYIGPMA